MSTDRFAFAGDHLTASFNAQSLGARVNFPLIVALNHSQLAKARFGYPCPEILLPIL
jgi:hypothetical protein